LSSIINILDSTLMPIAMQDDHNCSV